MGKGKRNKAKRAARDDGFGSRFSELLTKNFQKEIRNSAFWPMMVAQFGEEEAERLLHECKGEYRSEGPADDGGNHPEDL